VRIKFDRIPQAHKDDGNSDNLDDMKALVHACAYKARIETAHRLIWQLHEYFALFNRQELHNERFSYSVVMQNKTRQPP
jgi:hypothetical protein